MSLNFHCRASLRYIITLLLLCSGSVLVHAQESDERPVIRFVRNPDSAPDFKLTGLDGKPVTLADSKGKVILLNFWATWCGPCRVEIPWLMALQEKYGRQGFTVLGVAMDEEGKSAVAPFIQKERFKLGTNSQPVNYPILIGNDDVAEKFGGLVGLPTTILISQDGRRVKRIDGLLSYDEVDKTIQSLLETSAR